ncbi:MAG: cation diffusion facilitator family transporter [Treponema sp.]|nr:cation diffusion facilitator family transporter [Treponema sp.]
MEIAAQGAPDLDKKTRLIKIASLTALIGNAALAIAQIAIGIYAGSLAVIGNGIDSSTDVAIAIMALVVSRIISRPADAGHPWGHGRAETVATAILSFALFFAGAQLIISSTGHIISGAEREAPELPALIVTLVVIVVKFFLAWSQHALGKKADSLMLKANAKNMSADVLLSAGVLAGIGMSMFFGIGMIDSVAALLVGLWVIKSAIGIFIEANTELMDGGSSREFYKAIFDAVKSVDGAESPHRVRMRRIAGYWDIDIDIEVQPEKTVLEGHKIASLVEAAIKARVDNVYDIVVHVEPAGSAEEESFGLDEKAFP